MKLIDFIVERANKRYGEVINTEIIENKFVSIDKIVEVLKENSVSVYHAVDYLVGEDGFSQKLKYTDYADLIRKFLDYVRKNKDKEIDYVKIRDTVGNTIKRIIDSHTIW